MKNLNEIGLAENEMNLIYDSFNGIIINLTGAFWKYYIINEVEAAIYFCHLDKKWSVDKTKLIKKLSDLTDLEMLDLMEMVILFWRIEEEEEEEESYPKYRTITLSEKREEILSKQKES